MFCSGTLTTAQRCWLVKPLTGEGKGDIASIQAGGKRVPKSGRCIVMSNRFLSCSKAVSASQNTSLTPRSFDLYVNRNAWGHSKRSARAGTSQTNTAPLALTAISRSGWEKDTVNLTMGEAEGAADEGSVPALLEKTPMMRHSIQLSKKTSPSLVPTAKILSRGRDDWGYNQQPCVQFYNELQCNNLLLL